MNSKANKKKKEESSIGSTVSEMLRRQSPTGIVSLDKKIKTPRMNVLTSHKQTRHSKK